MSCQSLATIRLANLVEGDTWDVLQVAMTSDGTALAYALKHVTVTWTLSDGTAGPVLDEDDGVTITDAAAWKFEIDEIQQDTRSVGNWFATILCVDSAGYRKTRQAILQTVTAAP